MADDSAMPEGIEIDRSGEVPRRKDSRTVLHMIHDELGKALGIGSATDRTVNVGGKQKGLMDAVDDAVKDAPAPGSGEY